jgi:hypothetical protein
MTTASDDALRKLRRKLGLPVEKDAGSRAAATASAKSRTRVASSRPSRPAKLTKWQRRTGKRWPTAYAAPQTSSGPVPRVIPPQAPLDFSPAMKKAMAEAERKEVEAEALTNVVAAVFDDEQIRKALARKDDGPFTVACAEPGCEWKSNEYALLANAVAEHDLHCGETHAVQT